MSFLKILKNGNERGDKMTRLQAIITYIKLYTQHNKLEGKGAEFQLDHELVTLRETSYFDKFFCHSVVDVYFGWEMALRFRDDFSIDYLDNHFTDWLMHECIDI
jgi:hypothetical protein